MGTGVSGLKRLLQPFLGVLVICCWVTDTLRLSGLR